MNKGWKTMSKLGSKILRVISGISIISMGILIVLNLVVFKVVFSILQTEAKDTVEKAVSIVNGDAIEKVISNKSMDSEEYKQMQQKLVNFKNDEDIRYIYTLAKENDSKAYIVVDGSISEPEEIGAQYDLENAMIKALNGEVAFNKEPKKDDFGIFISAYAPIKNSAGNVVAIIGADKEVTAFMYIREILIMCVVIAAVVILILSYIATRIFSKRISKNVHIINEALDKMAEGDLTVSVDIKSKDEFENIAKSLNHFANNCRNTIMNIKEASNNVLHNSENLSAISEEMAASSEVVAASIEEVSKNSAHQSHEMSSIDNSLNIFGNKLDEAVNDVNEVNSKVEIVNSKAIVSSEELTYLDNSIRDIVISFNDVSDKINGLSMNLAKINEITNVINGIADQTNLLALNAAIEAALIHTNFTSNLYSCVIFLSF